MIPTTISPPKSLRTAMDHKLPLIYRLFRWIVRSLLRVFFKEISCRGLDRLNHGPGTAMSPGGLIIAWHPNGLIDPALIFSFFPGRIVFGARHGLFSWPILGRVFRSIGTVPIFRASDQSEQSREERLRANQKSLELLATELSRGSFSALFPEGLSHDYPHLSKIRTGAARLYLQALSMVEVGQPIPVIIPVGLFYDNKNIFRSRAQLLFHEPIELPESINNQPGTPPGQRELREQIRSLTQIIENSLAETARVTENWPLYELMHRTRKLVRAERAFRAGVKLNRPDIEEFELGFSRVWYAYRTRQKDAKTRTDALIKRVTAYDQLLHEAQLEDYELSGNAPLISATWILISATQFILLYIFLPPVLLVGFVINVIPYNTLKLIDHFYNGQTKDRATIKLMAGAVLFPLFWTGSGILAVLLGNEVQKLFPALPASPVLVFAITVIIAMGGGYLALQYTELSRTLLRAIRIRMASKGSTELIHRLRIERSDLFDDLMALSADLALPGIVSESGKISPRDDTART
jgi:glycerol-3-phosphate O-acyltransferase / dihydroxyacetone phosphate acyltransferase